MVCFLAMPENYEDSIAVSQRFADMGGFSNTSMVPIRLREREPVSEVGERLRGKKYKWWKVGCTAACSCVLKDPSPSMVSVERSATGIVENVKRTDDGGISVHVLSFSQLIDGDKLGSTHGQKGLVNIIPVLDCLIVQMPPIVRASRGYSLVPDVYINPASVISRQTHGMVYESGASWRAARDCLTGMEAVYSLDNTETEEYLRVLRPHSGAPMMRRSGDGKHWSK